MNSVGGRDYRSSWVKWYTCACSGVWGNTRTFSAGVLLLACTGTTLRIETNQDAARKAAAAYKAGDLDRAVTILQQAVDSRPDDAQLHFMLGNALFRCRDWSNSASQYSLAAGLRGRHADTYVNLGYASYHAGRIEEAVAAWRRSLNLTPDDTFAQISLGFGLLKIGLTEDAQRPLRTATAADPNWRQRLSIDIRWNGEMITDLVAFLAHDNRDSAVFRRNAP